MPSYTAVVLSIEGVLARREYFAELARHAYVEAPPWLRERWDEAPTRALVQAVEAQHRADLAMGRASRPLGDREAIIGYVLDLLREERGPIDDLRAELWLRAFESGRLQKEIFADVPATLVKWRKAGVKVAVFSALPLQAQRVLVCGTTAGDLSPLIGRWYGPEHGRRDDEDAYARIASDAGVEPARLMSVVEAVPPAYAALNAGCQAVLMERQGIMGTPPHGVRVEVSLAAV